MVRFFGDVYAIGGCFDLNGGRAQDAYHDVYTPIDPRLAGLDEPFREFIRRFFIADESYRVIGEALGLPPATMASRISRGLVMLRGALEEEAQPAAGGNIDV